MFSRSFLNAPSVYARNAGPLRLEFSLQQNEYSYFRQDVLETWAGPNHWKLKARSKGRYQLALFILLLNLEFENGWKLQGKKLCRSCLSNKDKFILVQSFSCDCCPFCIRLSLFYFKVFVPSNSISITIEGRDTSWSIKILSFFKQLFWSTCTLNRMSVYVWWLMIIFWKFYLHPY